MQAWTGALLAMWAAVQGAPAQVLRVSGKQGAPVSQARISASPKAARIEALVSQAVQGALPSGWQAGRVVLTSDGVPFAGRSGNAALQGAARVEARFLGPLAVGRQGLSVVVSDERGPVQALSASVELSRRFNVEQSLKRGSEVTVSVRSGNVFVQARCIAQASAQVGERITVLCDNATRTLSATVLSSKEVEVTL